MKNTKHLNSKLEWEPSEDHPSEHMSKCVKKYLNGIVGKYKL